MLNHYVKAVGYDMTRERRRNARYVISRRGELGHRNIRFPCLIQDISTGGFLIICVRNLVVGQELDLRFELVPGQLYQCKIQIKHFDNGCFGSEITALGEPERELMQQFVQNHSQKFQDQDTASLRN